MVQEPKSMEHARRVAQLWDWLPAFRIVAETEHLPTASKILGVSPSALSRSVRLVEQELGQPLFAREGRSLVLNERGARFLEAVRNAMRGVHSGIEVVDNVQFRGPVRVFADDAWFLLAVLPAWRTLIDAHPELVPELVRAKPSDTGAMLRRGDVDVVVTDTQAPWTELTCRVVAEFENGVFVAPRHPLLRQRRISWENIAQFDHVAIERYDEGAWPTHRIVPRYVVGSASSAASICKTGHGVTTLPVVLGEALGLRQLAMDVRKSTPLFVVRRPMLAVTGRADVLATEVERAAAALC